jgi:hypothetical protein
MKLSRLFGSILLNLIAFNAAMFAGCAISGNNFQFNLILCIVVPVICAFAGEWGMEQREKRTQMQ